ncbi:MAG: DNA repair protein RecO [Candidatus Moranbacteria bacterium]|nr:DNA repair protein RecO [Candidatus Moranbacteria bacterium]
MEIRYSAIILKKKEVGETDRLYVLYTREQGKVQVVAKGVRKGAAKLAGQLETLMEGLVIIERGRGSGRIVSAIAELSFPGIRNDMEILRSVLETTNIFERLVGWEEPDQELFSLLSRYLFLTNQLAKEKQREKISLLREGFLFQLFAHLGYAIETKTCVVSGRKLASGEQHFFSPSDGGVLSGHHSANVSGIIPISESAIKCIRLFLSHRLESLVRIRMTREEVLAVGRITRCFLRWIEG